MAMGLCVLEAALAMDAWLASHMAGYTPALMRCPACCHPHVDLGELAGKAHHRHVCQRCGARFAAGGAAGVGNPLAVLQPSVERDKVQLQGPTLHIAGVNSALVGATWPGRLGPGSDSAG